DAFGMTHHAVGARQILDQVVAYAGRGPLPADLRRALHQGALELVAADRLVQHDQVPGIDDVLVMLQPVAVSDHPDRVVAPQPHAAQYDVLAAIGADNVVHWEQGRGTGRAHIDEDQPGIFLGRIGRLPDIHALTGLLAF